MEKMLNQLGEDVLVLRNEYLRGEINSTVSSIIFASYEKEVKDLIQDKSLSNKDFVEELKKYPKYVLTNEEYLKLINSNLIQQYDSELSKTNDKFLLELNRNIMTVNKHFRISQAYYKNFLGIDIEDLKQKANKSKTHKTYAYPPKVTVEEKTFQNSYNQFKNFKKARLTNVLNELVGVINEKKLVPMYKTHKEKPIYIKTEYLNEIATIKLNINLDLKNDFDKNIKLIKSFLDLVDVEIEKRLNYSLYK